MLGKLIETWSAVHYDAAKFEYATAYMHGDYVNYHFREVDNGGLEVARVLAQRWADAIGGEYWETPSNGSVKVIVTDTDVVGRRQARTRSRA